MGPYLRYVDPVGNSVILDRILPGARFTRMSELDPNHPVVQGALERVYQLGCTPIADCYNREMLPTDVPHHVIEFNQTFPTVSSYQPPCTPAAFLSTLIHYA